MLKTTSSSAGRTPASAEAVQGVSKATSHSLPVQNVLLHLTQHFTYFIDPYAVPHPEVK